MVSLIDLRDICKNYRVLYAEDDESISSTLKNYLSKFFKSVVIADNGKDALEIYKDNDFEIVLTDIKMPYMDGLELTKKIKELNPNQNVIIVSAYSEIDNFLKSIKLGVDSFIMKPIDYENLNKTLYKIAEKIKSFKDNLLYEEKIKIENNKMKQFREVFDKVAVVSKSDLDGNITHVNKFFCALCEYEKDELIGEPFSIVKHPEMSKSVYKELWDTVKNGEKWEGTIKNLSKNGNSYFVHYDVIPLFDIDENINEFIAIGFLTTNSELEKREFKRKVMTNYLEFKRTNINAIDRINSLEKELEEYKVKANHYHNSYMKSNLRLKKTQSQIEFLEKSIKDEEFNYKKNLEKQKLNLDNLSNSNKKLLKTVDKCEHEIIKLKGELEIKGKEVLRLNSELNSQHDIIKDLRDTIKNGK